MPEDATTTMLAPAQLARIEALTAARKLLAPPGTVFGPPGSSVDRLDLEMLAEWILTGPHSLDDT